MNEHKSPTGVPAGTEALVCHDIAKRQLHGLNKYGVSIADNPLTLRQWLQHAYEETLDKAVYLRRAIDEIDRQQYEQKAREHHLLSKFPPQTDS